MPRPRTHGLDELLDVAERLAADAGLGGVTIRGLAAASGMSNGAIYHAFGSLPVLLGQMWLRAAGAFLDLQEELADAASASGGRGDAVAAAASAFAEFADRRPAAARMLARVKRDELLGPKVPDELASAMLAQDERLVRLLVRLARDLWGRGDGACVEVMTLCLVDLPTAVFHRALTGPSAGGPPVIGADVRRRLDVAVRAVLALPPPPARGGRPAPAEPEKKD
ncbi:TetR/AcrR family transcriptional regulator [Actinomadura oligospora]|uniref:TetR/AcrR family transcriptional regulator n=1 Tax=Actinomadura oligospora TaxID=111804 RepID=UPI00047E110E|nr:TetR/AcrR family transcriptional regulator [Actinomadura oligospora]